MARPGAIQSYAPLCHAPSPFRHALSPHSRPGSDGARELSHRLSCASLALPLCAQSVQGGSILTICKLHPSQRPPMVRPEDDNELGQQDVDEFIKNLVEKGQPVVKAGGARARRCACTAVVPRVVGVGQAPCLLRLPLGDERPLRRWPRSLGPMHVHTYASSQCASIHTFVRAGRARAAPVHSIWGRPRALAARQPPPFACSFQVVALLALAERASVCVRARGSRPSAAMVACRTGR